VGFESFVYELGRGNGEAAHQLEKGKRSRRVAETFFSWTGTATLIGGPRHVYGAWEDDVGGAAGVGRR
jgi:hypothetical protein